MSRLSHDLKLKLFFFNRAIACTTWHIRMVSSHRILELHSKFRYGDSDSYRPHLVIYQGNFPSCWWRANPAAHTGWRALPLKWEQVLRPRPHFKENLSLPALVKSSHRQRFHLRSGCSVGGWNNSGLHRKSHSQHMRVIQAHREGERFAFLDGEDSGLILDSPAWISLPCLPQICFFLLWLPKRGPSVCAKTGETHWVMKEWEGAAQGLCSSKLPSRVSPAALPTLRASWSFDPEVSLIDGVWSYFVLFKRPARGEVGKRDPH